MRQYLPYPIVHDVSVLYIRVCILCTYSVITQSPDTIVVTFLGNDSFEVFTVFDNLEW